MSAIRLSLRARARIGAVAAVASAGVLLVAPNAFAARGTDATSPDWHAIQFPVQGKVTFRESYGDCRDNCTRKHQGNDLFAAKGTPIVAPDNGTIDWLDQGKSSTNCGNGLSITFADGWRVLNCHLNDDAPGTDNGKGTYAQAFGPNIKQGAKVTKGQLIGYVGDSGNAEDSEPHLHFELHRPDNAAISPYKSLLLAQGKPFGAICRTPTNPARTVKSGATTKNLGYWVLGRDGGVFSFGDALFYGSTGSMKLNKPVNGMAPSPTGKGYWLVASDGGIFAYGDATFVGSTGSMRLNKPVNGMAPTSTGKGYWLFASDGGVFAFGDARFYGSLGGKPPVQPVIAMMPTATGKGYWMLTADGRVSGFGDAANFGSLGDKPDNTLATGVTAVGLAPTKTSKGYWILASNGAVKAFGDAIDYGDVTREGLCTDATATAIRASATGQGYFVATAEGAVYVYGDAAWSGDLPDLKIKPNQPVLGVAVSDRR
ncbi:MAG: M23 family metallopeptidase [Acidimicrobiia bacterium]